MGLKLQKVMPFLHSQKVNFNKGQQCYLEEGLLCINKFRKCRFLKEFKS